MSVRPTVRTEHLDSHEIWYLNILRKSVDKIQVSLKCDQNSGTLYEDILTFIIVSRSVLFRTIKVSDKAVEESKHTFYVQ